MLPQARLVARLKSLPGVTELVGGNVFGAIVPDIKSYPAIVYQVLSNPPANDADGSCNQYMMRLRITAIALSIGGKMPPYDAAWAIAMAIVGDAENEDGPTGISGWIDDAGSVWHVQDMFDEAGAIELETGDFWAYCVNIPCTVQWTAVPA